MLRSEFDLIFNLLHQVQHFFFVPRVGDHMNAHRESFRTLHRLIAHLVELVLVVILEILLISFYCGYWDNPCRIIQNAPYHGKGRTETKLLSVISLTFACPSLKAGIKNPGQMIRSISLLLRYW